MGNAGGTKPPMTVESGVSSMMQQIYNFNEDKNGKLFDYNGDLMNW